MIKKVCRIRITSGQQYNAELLSRNFSLHWAFT